VYLYWNALDAPKVERSVSVRIIDSQNNIISQHDSMPGGGSKPTSWWQKGWTFRDIYYLDIPTNIGETNASLDVVLYDTYSLEVIPFAGNRDVLNITPVIVSK
jgi:hypothetical protein